ncbi:MAG: hypothetical protein ACT4OO_13115 [Nitrospiraceae bacterium]
MIVAMDGHTLKGISRRRRLAVFMAAALVFCLSACGPSKVSVKTSSQLSQYSVRRIAVLPFEALTSPQIIERRDPSLQVPEGVKASNISVAVPPATHELNRLTTVVPASAAEKVTQLMWTRFQSRQGLEWRSPSEGETAAKKIVATAGELSSEALAGKVAERLAVDAVVVGKVLMYREREGSRFGGDPAIVGFEVKVVTPDGVVLWEGNYYERQRPMTEDLWGFIQRKGTFVTADELAAYGADRLIQKFPFGTPRE